MNKIAISIGLIVTASFAAMPAASAPETFRDCGTCPKMAVLPAGGFLMGSPESEPGRADHEGPQVPITFDRPFAIGITEITRTDLARFVEETGYPMASSCFVFDGLAWDLKTGFDWQAPGFPQGPDHPAVCVNLADAEAYARWISGKAGKRYRLPSEAEWEYAARAGETIAVSTVDLCDLGNGAAAESGFEYRNTECRDGHAYTAPVDALKPNAYGLYGMLGNVLEWTADCYAPRHDDADPAGAPRLDGDCRYQVLRGGNWAAAPQHLRPANRGLNPPGTRWSTNGFRLVRELD